MPPSVLRDVVKIEEEAPESTTGGRYGTDSISFSAAPDGATTTHDVTVPIPISLLTASIDVAGKAAGDSIGFDVAPETLVGGLPSPVAAGATIIDVPQSVVDLFASGTLFLGQHLILDDGVGTKNDCGIVTAFDKSAKQLTVKAGTQDAFPAGALLKITTSMSPGVFGDGSITIEPGASKVYAFGESKIGGSFIPAGTVIRIRYKNTAAQAVNVVTILEYLY